VQHWCWVAKGLLRDGDPLLAPLDEAIASAERLGQRERLLRNVQKAHLARRDHREEYDDLVLDHLTEACALAWAERSGLPSPGFDQQRGAPDIHAPPATWIEAKAVGLSVVAQGEMLRARSGGVVSGHVDLTGNDRRSAFKSHFEKAVAQLRGRPGLGQGVVFFNLTSWSFGQMIPEANPVPMYVGWLKQLQATEPDISVVFCKGYDWRSPILVLHPRPQAGSGT
jgi:hypothetical protein